MKQIGIGFLIVIGIMIVQAIFIAFGVILPSEFWIFLLSLIVGTIFIKFSKITSQLDIGKISLAVALVITIPGYFNFSEGSLEEINILLTQTVRGITFFITTYIGLVIPFYLSSRVKKSNKN